MTAVPPDTNPLPHGPRRHTGTDFVDDARHLVPGSAGILNAGPPAFLGEHVAMADPTGLYLYPYLSRTRAWDLALDELKVGPRSRYLCHLHGRYRRLGLWCSCHSSRGHNSSYDSTSKMTSSSTEVPSGRLATPLTRRQGFLFSPKTSCSNSDAASAILGWSRASRPPF